MIPWPIALLALFYGVIAAYSAATLWNIALGTIQRSPAWAAGWLLCSAAAALGLAGLRPWGRRMAIGTSWLLILSTLAASGVLVAAGRPGPGLAMTFSTACHYLMIRYLKKPAVLAWFNE